MLPDILPERGRPGIELGFGGFGSGGNGRPLGAGTLAFLGLLISAAVGCRTTAPVVGAAGASSAGSASESSFQADVAPISALAFTDPFLWVGSARGLRRFRLPAGPNDWIAPEGDAAARSWRISALTVDGSGRLVVASDAGVVALSDLAQAHPHVERLAPATEITHLAVVAGSTGAGILYAASAQGVSVVENGRAVAVAGAAGAAVTSLDLDLEGKMLWAGLRGRGLVRIEGRKVTAAFGPGGAGAVDFVESVGVAALPNGTRVAVGRNAGGATRVLALRADGPEVLAGQPELPVTALVATPQGPLLLGGDAGAPRAYRLVTTARGQSVAGGYRFSPEHTDLDGLRLGAIPQSLAVPASVTTARYVPAGTGEGQLFAGTRSAGVARLTAGKGGPEYLPLGELASGARRLSVACLERERCVFSTGAGPGWIWDGRERTVKPIPDGAIGGDLMALAGDGSGTVYFVTAGAAKNLSIARLSADGGQWQHLLAVPVAVEGKPLVGFATLSPKGDLWMTVRDRAASGQEFGRGVLEVRLPSGRATHHRPYTAKEVAPPEAIPVTGDVAAIRFEPAQGQAPESIWFCTATGVLRFGGGNLERWGENEGLVNEHCNDLLVGADRTVWIATDAGGARFDGKQWYPAVSATAKPHAWPVDSDGDDVPARAVVAAGGGIWGGTPKGVWPLRSAGPTRALDRSTGLFDDDVVDVVIDRFGRLWSLGHVGLTIRPSLSDISHI